MTTSTTKRNSNTEAHQGADFLSTLINTFPLALELANPQTISDKELRRITSEADSLTQAYITGFIVGRQGLDFNIDDRRGDDLLPPHLQAMYAGARDGVALRH